MIVAIDNTPRDYAWGSTTAIAELLGYTPTGSPEAELWFGAHPGSPSRIVEPGTVGGARDLAEWIADDPTTTLGGTTRLPFLMKVLAAESPLSLQAHPTAEQAREGFERENALGIALDAPNRNYRDEYPKPEILVALSDGFDALCGFRPKEEAADALTALDLASLVPRLDDLPELFAWLLGGGSEVESILARLPSRITEATMAGDGSTENSFHRVEREALDTVQLLSAWYPGDPGIVCALLLNRVTLRKGEALYLPAGSIHAYLSGTGIEVMTASDTVLRGGLTPKHVDVPELIKVLDFAQGPPPRLQPTQVSEGVAVYRAGGDDFVLNHITGETETPITGPAIALCVAGEFEIFGETDSARISRGHAVFITPDERKITTRGGGSVFLATTA